MVKKLILKFINAGIHLRYFYISKKNRYYISENLYSSLFQLKYLVSDYLFKKRYKIICFQGEFQQELCFVLPFAYWHFLNGTLEQTISCQFTKELYFFSTNHLELYKSRSWQYNSKDFEIPNRTHTLRLKKAKWKRVPLKMQYQNDIFCFSKPILVIANKYNIEWDGPPSNFIDIRTLQELFECTINKYQIIYNRPVSENIVEDNSQILNLGDFQWIKEYYPEVIIMQDLLEKYRLSVNNFNHLQLLVYANTHSFISVHGGTAALASYFGGSNIILSTSGVEHEFGEFRNIFSELSGACIYPVNTRQQLVRLAKEIL